MHTILIQYIHIYTLTHIYTTFIYYTHKYTHILYTYYIHTHTHMYI